MFHCQFNNFRSAKTTIIYIKQFPKANNNTRLPIDFLQIKF